MKTAVSTTLKILSLLLLFFSVFTTARQGWVKELQRAILVVGNKNEISISRNELEVRDRLKKLQVSGKLKKEEFKFLAYDFAIGEQKKYCRDRLGIDDGDLPLLGVVVLDSGGIPSKLLWKTRVKDPEKAVAAVMEYLGLAYSGSTSQGTPQGAASYPVVAPPMVSVKGGEFGMGNKNDAKMRRTVKVSDFLIGKYEVTNREYVAFLNSQGNQVEDKVQWINITSDRWCGITAEDPDSGPFSVRDGYESRPVVYVTWYGAVAYCNWLSERKGLSKCYGDKDNRGTPAFWRSIWFGYDGQTKRKGYRLPTEAEWECACRAGSETAFPWGDAIDNGSSWHLDNSEGTHRDVGTKSPNKSGTHDMNGNVWEWCTDLWVNDYAPASQVDPTGPVDGFFKVKRGGAFNSMADYCSSYYRFSDSPVRRASNLGFRLAMSQ